MDKLLLIDGHNYLFRSYYGIPASAKLPNGIQVNAYYGFISLLKRIYEFVKPANIIVVFDSETGINSKVLQNTSYKQNRRYLDTGMFDQLTIIKEALDYLNISYIEHPDYEGDDVIGSIAKREIENSKVYISSQDKDFFQLIDDKISVLRTETGKIVNYDQEIFSNKYGFSSNRYLEYMTLVGDPSDNVKGMEGIGKKRAFKIISESKNIFEDTNKFGLVEENYNFLKINYLLKFKYEIKNFSTDKMNKSSNEILKELNIYS